MWLISETKWSNRHVALNTLGSWEKRMNLEALRKISYGLYIITSGTSKCNGQIANTVFQMTSDPVTIAACINKRNYTHELIKQTNVFAISVLSKNAPMKLIGNFGFRYGRDFDKFAGVNYKVGKTGTRIVLDDCIAYIEAEVIGEVDAGSHTLFMGRLVDSEILSSEEPMTYAYYHEVKKGTTPSSAPTYLKTEAVTEDKKMAKYTCSVCGYVYDPEKGDPDSGVKAGTPFEELPDSWVCPVCGAKKDQFVKTD
jgi:flavin reductase (DIM6/NTAB) family NADH-FMN oxidoreductase RutF/rubredoxin